MKFCKLRVILQTSNGLKTIFASKILFLKHYGQIVFINFCAGTGQPPTLVRTLDISKEEFKNIRMFCQEQVVIQLRVPCRLYAYL